MLEVVKNYAIFGGLLFLFFLWIGSLLRFRGVYAKTKNSLSDRNKYVKNQFYFLWVATADLCSVVRRLRGAAQDVRTSFDEIHAEIDKINQQIDVANEQLAAVSEKEDRWSAGESLCLETRKIENIKPFNAPDLSGVISYAERVVEDITTLAAIWRRRFKVENTHFCLVELLKRDSEPLLEYARREDPNFRILFVEAPAQLRIFGDPSHISRCFRTALVRAIKQSSGGFVQIRATASAPILSSKSLIEVRVTDSSKRRADPEAKYETDPDSYARNEFLQGDPSDMLRLNIAKYTASAIGGEMRFTPHKEGNMSFVLRFSADIEKPA